MVANLPFDPQVLLACASLLLLLVYPEPRRLLAPFWRRPIDWPLLALAVVAGACFVPLVWQALHAQVRGADELALLVGACLLYLGVAAIAVPGNPGSWGLTGGAIALAGGAACLAITAHAWQGEPPAATG